MFHLKVIFDYDTGELIYDRKLEEGNGPAIYGLEVCKAMDMDAEFLRLSEEIRKDLLGVKQKVLEPKQSKYNAQVFVHLCEICGKDAEDVHHIKFQCTADKNKIIDNNIQKDTKSNLVPLCKDCHQKVHNNIIDIKGYRQTSKGISLDYQDNTINNTQKKRKKKFSDETLLEIKDYYKEYGGNLSQKNFCHLLEEKKNIKLSVNTFSKIISDNY